MKPKYRLIITRSWLTGKYTQNYATSVLVWDSKEDALECKRLMEKATYVKHQVSIRFEEFTEPKEL